MSEATLQRLPNGRARRRAASNGEPVSASTWAAGRPEPATAYDDIWFQGRPQRP